MSTDLFLTGVTGFIGSSLLQKWLDSSDVAFHLLARSRHEVSADDRMHQVLAELYPDADLARFGRKIDVVEGDVSLEKLGLKDSDYERLIEKTSHIIHCAAAARFDLELEEARRTNVMGTANVLALARQCSRLEKIDYIGTAYVAGRRTGIIKEDELDKGQEHNNTYERSKLEAEKLVRESMSELPITIYRPSIVICDSKTGRVSGHTAFYRLLKMYLQGHLKMLPGDPACLLDLLPVDYIADATCFISTDSASAGKCYHLSAGLDNLTTLEEIRDLAGHHFAREKFVIVPPEEFMAYIARMDDRLSEEERGMIDELKIYLPYLVGELKFDTSNTLKALSKTGLEVPRVNEYFGRMAEYMMKLVT
jgi:thioester reductase-like protein